MEKNIFLLFLVYLMTFVIFLNAPALIILAGAIGATIVTVLFAGISSL